MADAADVVVVADVVAADVDVLADAAADAADDVHGAVVVGVVVVSVVLVVGLSGSDAATADVDAADDGVCSCLGRLGRRRVHSRRTPHESVAGVHSMGKQ